VSVPSSHCHLLGLDTLREGGRVGCEGGGGGGQFQDYEYNINNDVISKATDVERVTMEKCVKRILKQAEQIGKTSS
jgi:hypothetical protein